MGISNSGRFVATAGLVVLCAAGQSDSSTEPESHHAEPSSDSGRRHMSEPITPFGPVSLTNPDASCNVFNNAAMKASKAVRLHLTQALFNHLADGQANACSMNGTTTCNAYADITNTGTICTYTTIGTSTAQTFCLDTEKGAAIGTIALPMSASATSTRLDVSLGGTDTLGSPVWTSHTGTAGTVYDPILFEIVLDEPSNQPNALQFIQGPAADTSLYAVETDDSTAKTYSSMFTCRQPIASGVTDNKPTVRFRVLHQSSAHAVGNLNIGIVVQESSCGTNGCLSLPIILDPHIPNNG